jgi:hypothetical protein
MIARITSGVLLLAVIVLGSTHVQSHAAGPRIGFLSPGTSESAAPVLAGLRQGLREHGYVEGTHLAIEPRFANGQFDRLPELARELIGLPVDVVFHARDATRTPFQRIARAKAVRLQARA